MEPIFSDGEQDLWPSYKTDLERFDSLPDDEYIASANRIEVEGKRFIELLVDYGNQIGCSFVVTPPENVNEVNGASNDIWAHSIQTDVIQIPRFVFETRPTGKGYVLFRKEVPSAFILVNLSHELSHLERRRAYPDTYINIFKGKSPRGNRHEVIVTSEIREEEMSTDIHAFKLLKRLSLPITPEIFVAQIPRNDKMPLYRPELLLRLKES